MTTERTDPVVVLRRGAAQDDRLSYRARGILADAKSRPPNWRFDAVGIARRGKEGERAIRTALLELEKFGYLKRDRVRLPSGRIVTTWQITDAPASDVRTERRFSPVGLPPVGLPPVGLPPVDPPPDGQPPGRKPPVLLGRETGKKSPPPTPAERAASELVEELAVVVVAETDGKTAGKPSPAGVRSACRSLATDGWTAEQVRFVVQANDWTGARGGAVVAYLRGLTVADRPGAARKAAKERPKWCGTCDEPTRLLLNDQGRPRRGQHCPDCHPNSARRKT